MDVPGISATSGATGDEARVPILPESVLKGKWSVPAGAGRRAPFGPGWGCSGGLKPGAGAPSLKPRSGADFDSSLTAGLGWPP